jgi:hypothetical protein
VYTTYKQRDFQQFYHFDEFDELYKYATVDKNGEVWYWVKKPVLCGNVWQHCGKGHNQAHASHINIKTLNKDGICEDWEYSLCERPKQ